MRKKLIVIALIFCAFLALGSKSYGFVKDDFDDTITDEYINLVEPRQRVIYNAYELYSDIKSQLRENFVNFNESRLKNEMIIETSIKVKDVGNNKYEVYIGNCPKRVRYHKTFTSFSFGGKNTFDIDDLKKIFGLNENVTNIQDGYTWDANIIAKTCTYYVGRSTEYCSVILKAIYAGEDINKVYDAKIDDGSYEEENTNRVDDAVELLDFIKTAKKWLGKNPGGAIAAFIANLPRAIGDILQYWANIVQTLEDGNADHMGVTYKYDEITNGDDKEYNKYIKAGGSNDATSAIKTVTVKVDKNGNGTDDFKKTTPIPYTIVDVYTIGVGNVDFFDINFLTGNKSKKYETDENGEKTEVARHSKNSIWMNIRNIVSAIVKLGIYFAAAILLISLIWNGISIVRHTFDNPQAKAESQKIIEKLAMAVFALVGTIVVMSICIYADQEVIKMIVDADTDTYELPIRVNVENTFSFSTTFAGYARFMSMTSDPDEGLQILSSAAIYMVFALANWLLAIIGVVRILAAWLLSILGPIMSIRFVFGKQSEISLRYWAAAYAVVVLIQIPMAFLGKLAISIV